MRTTPWTAETLGDAIDGHARTAARLLVSSTAARGMVRDQLLADAVAWFDDACASLGICGILGWQTNREGVRDGDRPRLHHLGGSDAASWAAKTVLAPHHGRNENGGISSSIVWVLKQKEGPRDVPVAVTFDAHTATFRDRNAWGMP